MEGRLSLEVIQKVEKYRLANQQRSARFKRATKQISVALSDEVWFKLELRFAEKMSPILSDPSSGVPARIGEFEDQFGALVREVNASSNQDFAAGATSGINLPEGNEQNDRNRTSGR